MKQNKKDESTGTTGTNGTTGTIIGKRYKYIPDDISKLDLTSEFKVFGEHGDKLDIVVQENGPRLYRIKKSEMKYTKEV